MQRALCALQRGAKADVRADHPAGDGAAPLALLPLHGGRFQVCKDSLCCAAVAVILVRTRFTAAPVLLYDHATALGSPEQRHETALCPVLSCL